MTWIGHGEPAMIPVRIWEKSVFAKSLCPSMAMNIVGTPWNAVIFSRVMQSNPLVGENAGIGDIVVPWVTDAVIASTMPKQWNIGTWIIMRSAVERSMQSPIALPLLTTL